MFDAVHHDLIGVAMGSMSPDLRERMGGSLGRMADIAIVAMVHKARTRSVLPYSDAAFSRHLGIDRSNYRRGGYGHQVARMMQVLGQWTDQALWPIREIKRTQLQGSDQ